MVAPTGGFLILSEIIPFCRTSFFTPREKDIYSCRLVFPFIQKGAVRNTVMFKPKISFGTEKVILPSYLPAQPVLLPGAVPALRWTMNRVLHPVPVLNLHFQSRKEFPVHKPEG